MLPQKKNGDALKLNLVATFIDSLFCFQLALSVQLVSWLFILLFHNPNSEGESLVL